MNGFEILADSYRQLADEKKIDRKTAEKYMRVYEFLATCDTDDICTIFDSSAFNNIVKALVKLAVESANISKEVQNEILAQLSSILSETPAKEILESINKETADGGVCRIDFGKTDV